LANPSNTLFEQILEFSLKLRKMQEKGNKAIIVGNGGSAAISSHFSVDLTKNAGIRCINFNESDLITCFANDYGFDHWIEHAVRLYGDEGDIFICISSSGKSMDIINGCEAAKKIKCSSIITFSGFDVNNPLKNCGDINFWVDSKAYNMVENIHQLWLLTVVDLVIGKIEYPAN
jgi:phosphoheptose isomerase